MLNSPGQEKFLAPPMATPCVKSFTLGYICLHKFEFGNITWNPVQSLTSLIYVCCKGHISELLWVKIEKEVAP